MKNPPPDWDDRKLWDAMGQVPKHETSTNFNYRVFQKIARESQLSKKRTSSFWSALRFHFTLKHGVVAMATIVTCLSIWILTDPTPNPDRRKLVASSQPVSPTEHVNRPEPLAEKAKGSAEISQIAQNFDLIQDLEVIEHLDELR